MMDVRSALFAVAILAGSTEALKAQATPPNANAVTLEMLASDGYEVKAIQRATTRGFGFVVMMQRGASVRTCLMRISRGSDGRPARDSVCF